MIALLQRVSRAQVHIDGECVARIGPGMLALVGVQAADDEASAQRLVERVLGYRMFADAEHRMNLNLAEAEGGLLLVPQFTLAADTRKGRRPSFAAAAAPQTARTLFEQVVVAARQQYEPVASGRFGADMQVGLVNDGPVTFWLQA